MVSQISGRFLGLALLAGLLLAGAPAVEAQDFAFGDVAVGVSSGRYQIYDKNGVFKFTLTLGSGFTTGCAFDEDGNFFGTWFSNNLVRKLDVNAPHAELGSLSPAVGGAATPESIVFANDGTFYVGHVGGNDDILHWQDNNNGTFTFLGQANGVAEVVGTDWVDLAVDQTTIFHTSEGRQINRTNFPGNTQLTPFSTAGARQFALRLLPPGDGSGGLIVANFGNIIRLDGAGAIAQTYDVAGEDTWFALNLDSNGTSFWSGVIGSGNFYRFNIATGAVEIGPINTGTGGNSLFGLCVLGELTAGVNNPPRFSSPQCGATINVEPGDTVNYTVTAADDANETVTLDATGVPAGATHNPALPTSGDPATSDFSWTTDGGDANTVSVITYTATDEAGKDATCEVTIEVGDDLLVVLRSFDTTPFDGGVQLDWTSELEIDNAGFYLLRRDVTTDEIVRLNQGLIPAQGDIFQSADYSFVDETAINGVEYQYVLVDMDLYATETRHPGVVAVANPADPPIKLVSPAYGARLSLEDAAQFDWAPRSNSRSTVMVSADPTFQDAAVTLAIPVRGSRGKKKQGGSDLKSGQLTALQELAVRAGDQPLYWRIVEPSLGSTVNVSDTFSLWIDLTSAGTSADGPSPAAGIVGDGGGEFSTGAGEAVGDVDDDVETDRRVKGKTDATRNRRQQ